METIQETENRLTVSGRRFDKTKQDQYEEGSIELPVHVSKLGFRPYGALPQAETLSAEPKGYFGVPIDAPLAVHLIKNAFKTGASLLFSSQAGTLSDVQTKNAMAFASNAINKLYYGVTFDKKLILSILNQDNCEGLRAYLCARDNPEPGTTDPYHTSLVMIGVDVNGFDLGYGPDIAATAQADTAPNNSLIAEYGYPPGGDGPATGAAPSGVSAIAAGLVNHIDEHYILLKLASQPGD
jgi:hypothetical protein